MQRRRRESLEEPRQNRVQIFRGEQTADIVKEITKTNRTSKSHSH